MTPQTEGAELAKYDLALALSEEDQAEFAAMSDTISGTAPPIVTAPFRLPAHPVYRARPQARELLFIAAKSTVNDLTLEYLLREVLPLVMRPLTLHVVGNVTIPEDHPANVKLVHHENVEDVGFIYGAVDLAVNPTYAGGGVKTKTLEAIRYGVPILTTDEGARGLRGLLPPELIVNDKESFAWMIGALLDDPARRESLSRRMLDNLDTEDSDTWLPGFMHILRALHETKAERRAS